MRCGDSSALDVDSLEGRCDRPKNSPFRTQRHAMKSTESLGVCRVTFVRATWRKVCRATVSSQRELALPISQQLLDSRSTSQPGSRFFLYPTCASWLQAHLWSDDGPVSIAQ
eukprot:Mycagemm_TRINITY_DN2149_c0_g1::TRINITY_DN2149_c0_g1_i1::g.4546::m.4546 type:complete len:112 gc:universal TRINITY_DN2149_c0_g1_i1:668-333(-)